MRTVYSANNNKIRDGLSLSAHFVTLLINISGKHLITFHLFFYNIRHISMVMFKHSQHLVRVRQRSYFFNIN